MNGRRERLRVYEAYEVKNKRQKLRCLLLRRKKNFFFIDEVITWGKKRKRCSNYYSLCLKFLYVLLMIVQLLSVFVHVVNRK